MFRQHQPRIGAYALATDAGLVRTVAMVSLSIQQPWWRIATMVADFDANGLESRYVWGSKGRCLEYVQANAKTLRGVLIALRDGDVTEAEALLAWASVPGLGLPKAGFVLQLTTGKCGCMDVHNIRRLGLKRSVLTASKSPKTSRRLAKAAGYCASVEAAGGSGRLWDDWCRYLAARQPKRFPLGAEQVSALHCEALGV